MAIQAQELIRISTATDMHIWSF
uniref:Uncharacterized protein MANES_15G089000 n=1 Tax=Rhizophora mucronata TaxID=61149 RepID=A0A2P2IIG2_RHIMU